MIKYCTFAEGDKYIKLSTIVKPHVLKHTEIDKFNILSITDVDTSFLEENKIIFFKDGKRFNRGCGYWLWKPYIILQELNKLEDNDILIYSDVDHYPIDTFNFLCFNELLNTQCIYAHRQSDRFTEKRFIKKETINFFNISDSILNTGQMAAGKIICNKKAIEFVTEWLKYCCYSNLIMDPINKNNEDSIFKDHRHDQSIFSYIYKRNNFIGYNKILKLEPFHNI